MPKNIRKGSTTDFTRDMVRYENPFKYSGETTLTANYIDNKNVPVMHNHLGEVAVFNDWSFDSILLSSSILLDKNVPECSSALVGKFCNSSGLSYLCMVESINTNLISIYNLDGSKCFEYSNSELFNNLAAVHYGDFNGDGIKDFIILKNDLNDSIIFTSNSSIENYKSAFRISHLKVNKVEKSYIGDFNGDGRDDLCIIESTNELSIYHGENGNKSLVRAIKFSASPYDLSSNSYKYMVGDFDGDGKDDLLHISGSHHVNYLFSNGKGGFIVQRPTPESDEGKYDVQSGYFLPGSFDSTAYDSVLHILNDKIHIWKSLSRNKAHIVSAYTGIQDISVHTPLVYDTNSDGLDDLVFLDDSNNTVHIFQSNMCQGGSLKSYAAYHGISYSNLISQRHETMHSINGKNLSVPTDKIKIPTVSHYIWINNDSCATYLNDTAEKILSVNFDILPTSLWSHNLWINKSSSSHERTIKMFEALGGKVKFIEDLPSYNLISNVVEKAISSNSFGEASDYLRFTILKDFGGLYLDIDYQLNEDVTVLNKVFDFYASSEGWKADWVSSSVIGATKGHPIVSGALNYSTTLSMDLLNCELNSKDFSIMTGPGSISVAYFKHSNSNNNLDVVFTSEMGQGTKNLGVFGELNVNSISMNVNEQNITIGNFGNHWVMNTWSAVIDNSKNTNIITKEKKSMTAKTNDLLLKALKFLLEEKHVEEKDIAFEQQRNTLIINTAFCTKVDTSVIQGMSNQEIEMLLDKCHLIKKEGNIEAKNIGFFESRPIPVLSLLSDNKNFLFTNKADIFGESLAKARGHEFDTLEQLLNNINKGDTYVEVGANYGDFLISVSDKIGDTGMAYGFEPSPTVFPFLAASVAANNRSNVILEQKAVSSSDGEVTFMVRDEVDAGGSLGSSVAPSLESGQFNDIEDGISTSTEVTVPAVSLDTYFMTHNITPTLVRLDSEGFECQVIRGMQNTLKNSANLILSVELQPNLIKHFETQDSLEECLDLIYDNGFYVSYISDSSNTYVDKQTLLNTEGAEILAVKSLADNINYDL